MYLEKKGERRSQITHARIKKFLKEHFYSINFEYLPMYNNEEKDDDGFHEFYLFIWCVLTNRLQIAKTFWRLGKVF